MNIIVADDEELALRALTRVIKEAVPEAVLHSFEEAEDVIGDIKEHNFYPDVVFLDIEMSDMNGLELARYIKTLHPKVNIIFVTGFSQYALDAYKLRPSGYLTKPVTKEDVLNEINNLRCPPNRTISEKPVYIQCFGNFEIKHLGKTLAFNRAKCKEILAFLVCKQGDFCSMKEIADMLWEDGMYDRSRQKQLGVLRHELIKLLNDNNISGILDVSRGALAVVPDKFDCDYYMMLAGDNYMLNNWNGQFMNQYSWAEDVTATLLEKYAEY